MGLLDQRSRRGVRVRRGNDEIDPGGQLLLQVLPQRQQGAEEVRGDEDHAVRSALEVEGLGEDAVVRALDRRPASDPYPPSATGQSGVMSMTATPA